MAIRATVRFRADDIWDTPEDGNRYEVIDGQLFVTPPPLIRHQRGAGGLYRHLAPHVHAQGLGSLFFAPVGLVLDEENGIQPDLVFVSRERSGIISERAIEGAPDLIVEVLSPSTQARDRGIKMRRYARSGVPWYWILDPVGRALQEYRLAEQGYELIATSGPGSVFRPQLFTGVEIPIDDLWA